VLGSFSSHVPVLCTTGGALSTTITPAAGNRYYLVVPRNSDAAEGSYGTTIGSTQRPASLTACLPQHTANCP
jgi:hypothetical protein